MIGVIFATTAEARPFLTLSGARQVEQTPFDLYQVAGKPLLLIAVSGVGKVSAAVTCHALIREYGVTEVLNAGACGALRSGPGFKPGRLLCVTSAVEGDLEVMGKSPDPLISDGRMDWDLPAVRLVTNDRPVFQERQRKALAAVADLADMEGAAIARVAAIYNTPWAMIKGVTDTAGANDRLVLKKNLPLVSESIGKYIWEQLP
jgi:adenosylhomocysteine nucleosidase